MHEFWTAQNVQHIIQRAQNLSGMRPTESHARSVMLKTEWLYGTPNHQGTAALLDSDTYLPTDDKGRRFRALQRINVHAIRELVQSLGEERRAEAAYSREMNVQVGDRMVHYPLWHGRAVPADSGSARYL